jgi:hypothetical protein
MPCLCSEYIHGWIIQLEAIEVFAEMDFLTRQNILWDMENNDLKQRTESTSQQQVIKHGK